MPASPPPPTSRIRWSADTHPGHRRKNNEDTFLALTLDGVSAHYLGKTGEGHFENSDYIFAVGDGMGGAKAGEFASRIAIDKITAILPKGFSNQALGISSGFQDLFEELYQEIHVALHYLGQSYEECAGMGSTLSLCWVTPEWVNYAHIGDSRIYFLPQAGEIRQLTRDDNHPGWLYAQGKINEREARTHPRRHSLQRALGANHQFINIQTGSVHYESGDLFLLCSDGLTDGLWDRHLLQLLRNPEPDEKQISPVTRLIEASLERSGRDNTTAIVVECV
jgi:serine/threonine protein phosphatase PrpC